MLDTPDQVSEEPMAVTKKDIEGMNLKALNTLIKQATEKANEIKDGEIQEARAKVQEMAADLGISIQELVGIKATTNGRKQKADGTRTPAAMKYKLPNGVEWSGKGRLPIVLREALKGVDGYDEETFKFENTEYRNAALKKYLL